MFKTRTIFPKAHLTLPIILSVAIATSEFLPGQISPLIHNQALSHLAFHSNHLKFQLASFFPARAVAIVGVEWGEDVTLFAKNGYHVYAFEPASKFVQHLQSLINANADWNVTLIPSAASELSDRYIDIEYEDIKEHVSTKRLDDMVSEHLSVLSVDVQGEELDVLRGSSRILKDGLVDSLWVEAIACNGKVHTILNMLDSGYVAFDFVPWGQHVNDTEKVPLGIQSFAFTPGRPAQFAEYLDWMCKMQKERYRWLQTDFLMVRRELLTDELVQNLGKVAQRQCANPQNECVLRRLVHEERDEL